MVSQIYPSELQLNKTYSSDSEAPFLDLSITNGIVLFKIYDYFCRKRCQCCKMITCAGTVKSSSGANVRLKQNKLHNRECCLSDLLQQLKQTVCRPMIGHRDDWRHSRFERSPTAEHFHFADHGFLSHASVCCLKHNHEWSDSTR